MRGLPLDRLALGAAGGVLAGVLAVVLLSALARPHDFTERTRRIEAAAQRVERVSAGRGDPQAYSAGALCREPPPRAAESARRRLEATAAASSLTLSDLVATAGAASSDEPLAPVSLTLKTRGTYENSVLFLNKLAGGQPEIFADTVDLQSEGAVVVLELSGRILCSTSARL